ncbi:uncharacterized protein LOC108088918 [Drosophila ficusphila]|uniref:uncharacterized protein LOC108088918 n=1 Tax=Drosophila ficusphila TaxID=30025 RepID=UPI0007E7FD8A|nr:uncharacterized protein LOC108088918 [Drosophila ficusphila]
MNIFHSLILFGGLGISVYGQIQKADPLENVNTDMERAEVRKTKDGWECAGMICPKFTASCRVTKVLYPSQLIDHFLLIICMDKTQKKKCGLTRSRRGEIKEILEVDDEGNTVMVKREVISTNDGTAIPLCPRKK